MSSIGKLVRKSQASLFWCMRGLPKAQREAIYTLYAFCRHIDNVIDGNMPRTEKEELLNTWRQELENIYEKKVPATDIGRKIYKNCMRFKIRKEDLSEILNCALLDFPHPLQAPDFKTFKRYGHGVSEIPFYITLLIIGGMTEQKMRDLSESLGRAVHLTTILKNVKEDAQNGHLYMPSELLQQAGISVKDPVAAVTDKNLIAVREQLARQAATDFSKAYTLLSSESRKKTHPLRFILNFYKRYFDIMQNRGWEIMSPKPHINPVDKLAIVINTLFKK